jgi:hypothetical protein
MNLLYTTLVLSVLLYLLQILGKNEALICLAENRSKSNPIV